MIAPVQLTRETTGIGVQVEYSSMSAFSAANKWLLLIHNGGAFGLYSGDGQFAWMLPKEINASAEPRWDRHDPDLIYFCSVNSLKSFSVKNGNTTTILRTFNEYAKISGKGESEISLDGDHMVLRGTRTNGVEEVFVYELPPTNRKLATFIQAVPFDGLKILPSNQALLSRKDGIWLLREPLRQILRRNAHAAVAQYQGRDMLIHVGGVSKTGNKGAVSMVDVDALKEVSLLDFDYKYAAHVSTCEKDFCLVSLAAPDNSLPAEIWKAHFDGTAATLLHQFQSKYRNYESAPKVSLSRDGSRAVFNWDDGKNVNVWMLTLDSTVKPAPPPEPIPIPVPPPVTADPLAGFHPIDFRSADGKQYLLKLKVVDGKLECEMWEKPA